MHHIREELLAHNRDRRLPLGTNESLYFEDTLTMQHQVQEMLCIERIFEEAGIREEIDAYNPLIPDGTNRKASFMLEFPGIEECREMLKRMVGIENKDWARVGDLEKIWPVADKDLERTDKEKTSVVHNPAIRTDAGSDPSSVSGIRARL